MIAIPLVLYIGLLAFSVFNKHVLINFALFFFSVWWMHQITLLNLQVEGLLIIVLGFIAVFEIRLVTKKYAGVIK